MANQGKRMVKENLIADISQKQDALTAGTGINIAEDVISVDTNTIATTAALQSFTESFGGALTNIYNGTSVVGKAKQDENGREIDEYYASKQEVAEIASKTLPTYGLGIEDLPEGSTTFDLPLATLIAAGLPILASDYTSASDYIYKDNVVNIEVGSYFNIHGMIAMATDTTGGLRFYSTSNNGLGTNKQIYTIQAYRTGGKEYTFNYARYRAKLNAYQIDSEYGMIYVHDMVASTDGIVGISGNPDNEPVNITYTYMTVNNPQPNVRYRTQLAAPTTDGTYTLKATIANGLTTFSWVLDQA